MTLNQGVANALTGSVRSTGWRPVSTERERSCARKGIEKMRILVYEGQIENVPGYTNNSTRWIRGNNSVYNLVCSPTGGHIRVDLICFNPCDSSSRNILSEIKNLMNW
ncbi:MAG: hypothetical protein F6K44_32140 [Moorea sp. SIO3E2]|nr:hypothetical protein [Moorena sp. SIO3E2]